MGNGVFSEAAACCSCAALTSKARKRVAMRRTRGTPSAADITLEGERELINSSRHIEWE